MSSHFFNDANWGCLGITVARTSEAIGTGLENTQLIVSGCSEIGIAAKICNNLSVVVNDVTVDDWFSPSIEELNQVYMNRQNIPLLSTFDQVLLSSTQKDAYDNYYIDFNNSSFSSFGKSSGPFSTIAIRRF